MENIKEKKMQRYFSLTKKHKYEISQIEKLHIP